MISMTYELRRIENEKYKCPKCGGRTVKAGIVKKVPRRKCQECSYAYTK